MNNTPTPIQPFVITTTQTISSFTVNCRTLVLFTSATFTVDSFDVNNILVSRQVIPITTEQYLEWNNNDSYIIDLIAKICGYTLVTPIISSSTQQVVVNETEHTEHTIPDVPV
jgi:hypothetical protein